MKQGKANQQIGRLKAFRRPILLLDKSAFAAETDNAFIPFSLPFRIRLHHAADFFGFRPGKHQGIARFTLFFRSGRRRNADNVFHVQPFRHGGNIAFFQSNAPELIQAGDFARSIARFKIHLINQFAPVFRGKSFAPISGLDIQGIHGFLGGGQA